MQQAENQINYLRGGSWLPSDGQTKDVLSPVPDTGAFTGGLLTGRSVANPRPFIGGFAGGGERIVSSLHRGGQSGIFLPLQ